MVLILSEDDVSEVANLDDVIDETERALREYSEKKAVMPPRYVMESPGSSGTIRLMPASIPSKKATGLKILTGTAGKRRKDGVYFLVSLFDEDGSVRCMMGANRLTQLRTGAASAVATKYLARKDSKIIGIIGAGIQGQGQLEAIIKVLPLESGLVFDFYPEASNNLAKFAKEKLNFDLKVASSALDLTRQSDIVVTTTTSKEPFLTYDMLRPGTHVNAVGSNLPSRRELDESVLNNSTVYVDSIDQVVKESGDLISPIASGAYSSGKLAGEIGEVVSGTKPGRGAEDEVTVFKSVGIAVEDVAVANAIFQKALKQGIGREVKL